jgi:hypothetical protein
MPLCPIVYQQATEYYIQARLEDDGFVKAGETLAGCALEGFKRGLETTGTIELKAYTSLLQTGLCLTAQDKCIGEGYWTQFGYGATNALLQELDVAAMAEGILIIVGVGLKNQFECIKKGGTVYLLVTANSYEEAIHTISQCLLGVDMTLPEWKALYAKVSGYAEKNWKEPYLHGQAVVFVASLAIPITKFSLASKFGKFSKAKLLNKLKANPTFANQVDDLTAISKAADEGKDVGKVVDDIVAKGGAKPDDALLDAAKAFDDNVIDVASVGFQNWKTFQNRVAEQLKNLHPGKKIGNQITLDVYVSGRTTPITIIPDNLIQIEVNGVKKYKVIDAKTANSDLVNKADLTSTCTQNQQAVYPLIDGTTSGSTITKVEMRGAQAQNAFGENVVFDVNGKATIQLETGVEFWVNSSTIDFTQYLIRPRIK